MTRPEPRTLLLVPTGTGVGLTSACLGLIRALDTLGLKASFLRPFRQDEFNGPGPDRSTALARSTLGLTPPEPLSQVRVERLLRDDRIADLMEEAVARHTGPPPARRRHAPTWWWSRVWWPAPRAATPASSTPSWPAPWMPG